MTALRVVLADDESRIRELMTTAVENLGHEVVATCQTGRELVEQARSLQPDLLITDIKMPDMDGIEAAAEIYKDSPLPVILVSAFHDEGLIERALQNHVLSYLVKPISAADLQPAIALATARFEEFETLRQEAADSKQALEDRKLIERAKGILMKRAGLDEPEAFARLQKRATHQRVKLVEVAKSMIAAEELVSDKC